MIRVVLLFTFCVSWIAVSAQSVDTSVTVLVVDTTQMLDSNITHAEDVGLQMDSSQYFSQELKFATYLITNDQYDDADYLLSKIDSESKSANSDQRDSITYMRGWIRYFNQDFSEAIDILQNVNGQSPIAIQSSFYEAICHVYLSQYDSAKTILANIPLDSGSLLSDLRYLQYASIALLERDYLAFDSVSKHLEKTYFEFSTEEQNMFTYHEQLSTYKRKSPFIAGGLSALFPGIGKFYAGYRGTPFGTMYMTLPLAAVAVEAAIIAGLLSPQFLVLGSLFGIFYIGNIWGSALSVYSIKKEIYDEIDRNILFDMHIPLRRVFWQ